jgi:hypothetical protein
MHIKSRDRARRQARFSYNTRIRTRVLLRSQFTYTAGKFHSKRLYGGAL